METYFEQSQYYNELLLWWLSSRMFPFIFLEPSGFLTQDFSQTRHSNQPYVIFVSVTSFWHLIIDSTAANPRANHDWCRQMVIESPHYLYWFLVILESDIIIYLMWKFVFVVIAEILLLETTICHKISVSIKAYAIILYFLFSIVSHLSLNVENACCFH